ncbi:MAG: DedA family protein [Deltaproteobacteria bacterium]|nr:DedA family protein [Deltaproteobacteria bacterium]
MLESIATSIQQFIADVGYPGLLVLIILESTLVPVPSMLVMPFAGYLASTGTLSLPLVLLVNAAGAAIGSTLSYLLGVYAGAPFLEKYGKWFLIKHEDIVRTHDFFAKYGTKTIFFARFLPVVRHVISVPAGIARMRFPTFLGLTIAGATAWGGGLIVMGYELGARWESIAKQAKKVDLAIAALIVVTIAYFAYRFLAKRKRERAAAAAAVTPDAR